MPTEAVGSPTLCHTGLAGPAIHHLYICAALEACGSQGPLRQGTVRPASLLFSGRCSQVCASSPAIPKGFVALFPTCVVVSISWARLMLAQLGQEHHEGLSDVPPAVERSDQGVTCP